MIMLIKKSHNLLTISWRTSNDSDILQSKSEDLQTREFDGVSLSSSSKAPEAGALVSKDRRRWMYQLKERKQMNPSSTFVLSWSSVDWMMPAYIGEGNFFTQFQFQILISSTSTLTDTLRNEYHSPVELTHKIINDNDNNHENV